MIIIFLNNRYDVFQLHPSVLLPWEWWGRCLNSHWITLITLEVYWTHIGANEFRLVNNILPVELRAKQLIQVHILNGTAPVYLNTAFKLTLCQHNINTRSSTMSLQIPQVKSFEKILLTIQEYWLGTNYQLTSKFLLKKM